MSDILKDYDELSGKNFNQTDLCTHDFLKRSVQILVKLLYQSKIYSFQNPASLKWNQRWPKWQSVDWGHGWWTTYSSSSPFPVSLSESSLASSWSLWSWTLSLSPTSGTQENSLCGFWNSWFYLWLLLPWLLVSKFLSSAFRP